MLTINDIETAIEQSPNQDIIRKSISNYFENLDEPVIVAISLNGNGYDKGIKRDAIQNIVNGLRQKGIDAVSFMDEAAVDPSKFVVNLEGIQSPFLSPADALKATVMIEDVVCSQKGVYLSGHANLLSNDSILYSKSKNVETLHNQLLDIKDSNPHADKIPEILSKYGEDFDTFIDRKVSEAVDNAITIDKDAEDRNNSMNGRENLWRGATLIGKPFAVVSPRNARKVAYASSIINVSAGYTGYVHTSSGSGGAMYPGTKSGKKYGCLFKFKSLGDEQIYYEDTGLEAALNGVRMKDDEIGLGFETAVYHHKNKIEAMYLQVGDDKFFPIPIDEKGRITDSEWKDFAALHEPSDSSVYGYEAIRRDAQKQEQDLNPNHCYNLDLKQGLETKNYDAEYFRTEDIAKAVSYRANLSKDNDGHINIYQDVNIDVNIDKTDLKNITVYGTCTINNDGTKSILHLPNLKDTENGPSTRFNFIGDGKLTDVDKISTEQLLKIVGANKEMVMIYSHIELDTLPKDFNQYTYNSVSVNSTVEKMEDFPDTVMGCYYLKVKDQSSIENMDVEAFKCKLLGKYRATVENKLDLSTTNIVSFPKKMRNETLEQIKFNPKYEVQSLDNCPNTKQGISGINFVGSLENLTTEEFLTKVKGENWCKEHIVKQSNGLSIVKDLDFGLGEEFKIKKYPKDIAKYSFSSGFGNNKQSQAWNNEALKAQILEQKNNDEIVITAKQALAVGDMSEFKCSKISINGTNEDLSSLKLPANAKQISFSNVCKLPSINEQCSAITLNSCCLENNVSFKYVDDVRLSKCDCSKIDVKFPANAKKIYLKGCCFSENAKLDFSNCEKGNISDIKGCASIKMPKMSFGYTTSLPDRVSEISTTFIQSANLTSIADNIKIVDTENKDGKNIPLKILKNKGLSKTQISKLRKGRLGKIFNKFKTILKSTFTKKKPNENTDTAEKNDRISATDKDIIRKLSGRSIERASSNHKTEQTKNMELSNPAKHIQQLRTAGARIKQPVQKTQISNTITKNNIASR